MSLIRLLARPLLATTFIVHGAKTLLAPDQHVPRAKPVTDRVAPMLERVAPQLPTDARTLVQINAAVQLGAGLLLATGRSPRLASLALAASLVPTTLANHAYWQVDDPEERAAQREQLLKNLSIGGGLLIAGVDTEGRPGVVWRAQHAGKRVSGEARRAGKSAKREAKKAKREAKLAARAGRAEIKRSVTHHSR